MSVTQAAVPIPTMSFHDVRETLLARREIALIDVREEDPYAQEHPLWAANFPLGRLELDAWERIPRKDTRIVVYGHDASGDLTPRAVEVLRSLGYSDVFALEGGLEGWRAAGGELFRDVNVPSKAFGEYVEFHRHTPSLSAQEVQKLIDDKADMVIVDARRYDEYNTMSIPTATSVPGAELVLRIRELAPDPATRVVVNCAGRTRSIIGAQSLVNAGIPNNVAALRNGTIGWKLAGQDLDHGATRRHGEVSDDTRVAAQADARRVADLAGVRRIRFEDIESLHDAQRTLYRFDVRTPEEYVAGHLSEFASAPGGQLVQETDHRAPVRGARIVLADDDGVRASMSGSWLAQMGWEVYVVDPPVGGDVSGAWSRAEPALPQVPSVTPEVLEQWLEFDEGIRVVDLAPSAQYVKGHIPGAWFAIRAQLASALKAMGQARRYVFTCGSGALAQCAAYDAQRLTDAPVYVLEGGNRAWQEAELPFEEGETHLACARTDRYRRPYEGTDAPPSAMQAYLDWEYGLVEQLGRDGTHGFRVA